MPTTTITASQVSQPVAVGAGSIVTVTPGSGATATVEYTGGSLADIGNGVAAWKAWAKGAVSAATKDYCADGVFLRVTAQGSSVSLDVNSSPSAADLASLTADWGISGGVQLAYNAFGDVLGLQGPVGVTKLSKKEWRGIGQGMSLAVQGFGGGASWSMTHRTRHYSNVRFRRVRAVFQTFYMAGTNPIIDTNFADDYNFQVGLEQSYANAVTGIAPRKMFTFGGSETAQYLAASPPASGYIVSDVMELDSYVEASQFFGLWTTVENPSAGANKIPYTRSSSNFLQKYIGVVANASSNINNNVTRTATSVTPAISTQLGGSNYFTPCMLLIETDSALPFVVVIGDSISYGVGESVAGSGTEGDGVGSALSNMGFAERAIHENLRYSAVNLSKGSDGNKYLITPANWAKRSQLLTLANPTHVINSNGHNELSQTISLPAWAATTAFNKWDVVVVNGNNYACVQAGTTGATSPSSTSGGIVDGSAIWAYIQPHSAVSLSRGSSLIAAQIANVNTQIQAAVPNVPIIGMTITPDSTSTDSWATAANQTVAAGWGDSTSRRGLVNALIRAKHPLLKLSKYIELAQTLEDSAPTETSKWASTGAASYLTNDGTHPNSTGYKLASAALTADKFV